MDSIRKSGPDGFVRVAAFVLFIIATGIAATSIYATVHFFSSIPFEDQWDGYMGFYHAVRDGHWGAWWWQHMEHRIVFSRVLFWLDLKFFGGRNLFTTACDLLLQTGIACLFSIAYLRHSARQLPLAAVAGIIVALLASWTQSENFRWGFQSQFIGVYLFSLLAFYAYTATPPRLGIATSLACVAELTMGNGLLAFPVLAALVVIMRRPKRDFAIVMVIGAVTWAIYLFGLKHVDLGLPAIPLWERPLRLLQFFLVFQGNPLYFAFDSLLVAGIVGAIAFAGALYLCARMYMREEITPYRAFLIATYLFTVLSALAATQGRYLFGLQSAASSRYATPTLIGWVALLLLLGDYVKAAPARRMWATVATLMVGSTAFAQLHILDDAPELYARKLGIVAVRGGFDQPQYTTQLFPATMQKILRGEIEYAVQNGIGIFKSGWPRDVGSVEYKPALRDDSLCIGAFDSAGADGIASGWAATRIPGNPDLAIVIADSAGATVGYGLTGASRPDVMASVRGVGKNSGWTGFVRPGNGLNAYVYVNGRFCQISNPRNPDSVKFTTSFRDEEIK